jgi:hypothetical protein
MGQLEQRLEMGKLRSAIEEGVADEHHPFARPEPQR